VGFFQTGWDCFSFAESTSGSHRMVPIGIFREIFFVEDVFLPQNPSAEKTNSESEHGSWFRHVHPEKNSQRFQNVKSKCSEISPSNKKLSKHKIGDDDTNLHLPHR